jgi:hypothetical protein
MNYGFFIKNLPVEIVELINSFVNPKTDYYLELLKEKVKIFCLNGLMRIEDEGLKLNHSYFHKKEFFEEFEEKKYRININKNIEEIIRIRDIFKKIFKPMRRKTKKTYYLKHIIEEIKEEYVSNGLMIMSLILLGVKYKKKNYQDMQPEFYCDFNDKIKKLVKNKYIFSHINLIKNNI